MYPLDEVKARILDGKVHVYKTSATDRIVQELRCSQLDAILFAKAAVMRLKDEDFCSTTQMHGAKSDEFADEYGILDESNAWYLKININSDDDTVDIISCHPPTRKLTTVTGRSIF
jgi:hypothetical protein